MSSTTFEQPTESVVGTINSKANKVSGATNGNLAKLNSNGDLVDSNYSVATIRTLVIDTIYPVGSIYISLNSSMPSVLTTGRTWERITAGYCLRTITSGTGGELTAAGKTGGTTLTVDQIPSHTHVYGDYWNLSAGSDKKAVAWNSVTTNQGGKTIATGGGGSHNHTTGVPANVAVYMWKRTA